jgi:hypothetical protein
MRYSILRRLAFIRSLHSTRGEGVSGRVSPLTWALRSWGAMSCPACGSGHEAEFPAEMMMHFTGLKHVDKPGVWLFPKLLICLDCGASRFRVPEKELALLASGAPKNERSSAQRGI